MKIPAFIKQLVKFCDNEASRYALGCIEAKSLNGVAQLTATDGRMMANVYWQDDGPAMDVLVNGKQLASPPAAAFKGKGVDFDGSLLTYSGALITPDSCDGKFPRYEDIYDQIHDDQSGYVAVKLDAGMLKVLADMAGAVSGDTLKPSVNIWVKDAQSAVFAAAHSQGGTYTARLVQMPLAADDITEYGYPPRPGEQPVEKPQPTPQAKREMRVKHETVYADGRRETGPVVNVTTGVVEQPAPPPETLDDDVIAEAVTREPERVGMAFSVPDIQ